MDTAEYDWALWRLKFRTRLPDPYDRRAQDPKSDVKTGGEYKVTWSVGFEHGATGSVSGDYTVVKAKKIHPWSDGSGVLYHVSWLSNSDRGSSGAQFWNGGGGAPSANTIEIWKCFRNKDTRYRQCDPKD